ncbi:MAG: AraC family transcriptional regulator, partial [Chitinophagales bacterium]
LNSMMESVANTSFLQRNDASISLTCLFSGTDCNLNFESPAPAYEINFVFENDYLHTFSVADHTFPIEQFSEYQQHEICCNSQLLLHEILTCKLSGAFRNMFLESKALALLLCFQKCNTPTQTGCDSCKFLTRPIEKEKLFEARKIILNNLNSPPTIPALALQTGINQSYLKKGFKELFGSTVYDFVQEQRMLKAKLLLTTTDNSVSQIANEIGFSSAGNFSAAFKKLTGVFPSELQRN